MDKPTDLSTGRRQNIQTARQEGRQTDGQSTRKRYRRIRHTDTRKDVETPQDRPSDRQTGQTGRAPGRQDSQTAMDGHIGTDRREISTVRAPPTYGHNGRRTY